MASKVNKRKIVVSKAESYKNLGNDELSRGRFKEALNYYLKALELNPRFPAVYNNIGLVFQQEGKLFEAAQNLRKALKIDPSYAVAYNNLGTVLQSQGKLDEALRNYKKAININPGLAKCHYNVGSILLEKNDLTEAIESFKKAIKIDSEYANAYSNMGVAFKNENKLSEAEKSFRISLNLNPDAASYYNLGTVFEDKENHVEAIKCFEQVCELDSEFQDGYAHLANQLLSICDWKRLDEILPKLVELTKIAIKNKQRAGETPFMNLLLSMDSKHNSEVARLWSSYISNKVLPFKKPFATGHGSPSIKSQIDNFVVGSSFPFAVKGKKKIRLGYLSSDFKDHATSHLMLNFFAHHDRKKFEVYIYSYGDNDGSLYRKKIKKDADKFVEIKDLSFADAAKRIYRDGIDILIDLKGHTRGNRLEICALRPAPIQVSWLGFPGTTGAEFMDYIIADKIVVPSSESKYYSEEIVYLPDSYQVNDSLQKISTKKFQRSDFNLPEKAFVFSSFVQSFKTDEAVFNSWMNILKEVPGSVLWLWSVNNLTKKNLKSEAKKRGIEPKRLVFATKLPKDEHLKRLQLADIALDTFTYNGHTTTSDCLWAGVPVVTLKGKHFASRVSSSLLTAIGLPELITKTAKQYEDLAISLATNPKKLQTTTYKLQTNKKTHPLFNTEGFTRNIEKAYETIWKNYLNSKEPENLEVK